MPIYNLAVGRDVLPNLLLAEEFQKTGINRVLTNLQGEDISNGPEFDLHGMLTIPLFVT
jgi:hypothetical protein